MPCSDCSPLRARITELEAELAEWKALAQGETDSPLLGAVCARLGLSGGNARLLARLLERPGTPQRAAALYRLVAASDPGELQSDASRRIGVHLHAIRRVLRKHGLPEPVGAHSLGWFYTPTEAALLLAFLGSDCANR